MRLIYLGIAGNKYLHINQTKTKNFYLRNMRKKVNTSLLVLKGVMKDPLINIMCCLDICNQENLEWPNLLSTLLLYINVSQLNNPPYKMDQIQFLLFLNSRFQFPPSPRNYSKEPTTAYHRNQGTPHYLNTTKPASHSPCLITLFMSATPVQLCMVYDVLLPQAVSLCD